MIRKWLEDKFKLRWMENGLKLTLGVPVDQVSIAAAVGLIASPLFKELDIKTFQLNINAHELVPSYIYCQGSNAKKIERFCTYAHKTCYHLILNRDSKCVKLQIFQRIAWRVWENTLWLSYQTGLKTFNNVQNTFCKKELYSNFYWS